jgi:hypothetical protein
LHSTRAKPDRLGHSATGQPGLTRLDDRDIAPSPGFIESNRNSPQLLLVPWHLVRAGGLRPATRAAEFLATRLRSALLLAVTLAGLLAPSL